MAGVFVVKITATKIPATRTPASKTLAAKTLTAKTLAAKTKYDEIKIHSSFWTASGYKSSKLVKNDQIHGKEIFSSVTLLEYIGHSDDWFSL